MSDNAKLKELAEALKRAIEQAEHKPGEWAGTAQSMGGICCPGVPFQIGKPWAKEEPWASFSYKRDSWLAVAAVNALPRLLGLIAEIERLRDSDQESTELCDTLSVLLGSVAVTVRGPEEPKSRHGFRDLPSRVKTVVAERDQLRAEVAGLRTGYEAYEQVVQGLKAEVERHRAYADKCESAAAGFSRQLQTALIELKALQGEKAAQGAIRKERQAEGIEKARAEGKYQGRPVDADLHARVIDLLQNGHGVRPTARLAKCSTTTVIRIKAALSNGEQS
ncbi:helix-turn-helix domain-containing protein [Pseudomonas moraviensis]|uniref:Resolvase n=1 Tax=Pseudomonas moraviensis R28-S TaxID=1395516 RepID=V8R6J1_9PSED|nr:helix-turn-helix domain-containing protein [Pseudomonas moraviensis]ETF06899.1 resolvase [Pseudomonas moraviensis R28-S]